MGSNLEPGSTTDKAQAFTGELSMWRIGRIAAVLIASLAVGAGSPAVAICMGDGEYEQALADIEAREAATSQPGAETPSVADAAQDDAAVRDVAAITTTTPVGGTN